MKHLNMLLFLDTGLPAVTLGQAIGRWGNFFNREVFGGYTNNLLAMGLPADILPAGEVTQEMLDHPLVREGVTFVQVHPTFLYESLWNTALLIIMLVIITGGRKKTQNSVTGASTGSNAAHTGYSGWKQFDGEIACLYLLGYGIGRFWIEGIRTDRLLIPGTGVAVSQVLSAVMAVAGGICLVVGLRRYK